MYDGRVRVLTLTPLVVALGLGGVALAQPAGVVDPWGRPVSDDDSWFGTKATPSGLPAAGEPKVPWAPAVATPESASVATKRIDVFPVSPAAAPAVTPRGPVVAPLFPLPNADVSVIDPWAPPIVASETPSLRGNRRAAVDRSLGAPWSERFVEVIDPWKRMPEFAESERVRLILDPWAR
jgi:hypothetical protein